MTAVVTERSGSAGERKDVPAKYKWNLADLYPSEAAWTQAKDELGHRLPELAKHRGHLGKSPKEMLATLQTMFDLDRDLSRLAVYANSLSDEDVRAARPREMKQATEELATAFSAACSWVRPEILTLPPAKVTKFLADEPKLAPYRVYLQETLRRKAHTLGAAEEKIASEAGELERAGGDVHGVLSNADLPYPTIKLSTGESVRLDPAAYSLHRQDRNRADRDKVFAAFFGALKTYERTMGATLAAAVKAHLFEMRVRHFDSSLEAALFQDNIPPAVYKQLLGDVHHSLPTLHRYLALRKRMLGVDVLRYQDLYVPLVRERRHALRPRRGARRSRSTRSRRWARPTRTRCTRAFASGWTDYLPSTGKRSGAYSTGVYGVHPYQLLNFNGQLRGSDDARARVGPLDAHVPVVRARSPTQRPTIRSSWPRSRRRSTRTCSSTTCSTTPRTTPRACSCSARCSTACARRCSGRRSSPSSSWRSTSRPSAASRSRARTCRRCTSKIAREYYGHDKGVCQVDDLLAIEWAYVPALLLRLLRLPVRDEHGRLDLAGARRARGGRAPTTARPRGATPT